MHILLPLPSKQGAEPLWSAHRHRRRLEPLLNRGGDNLCSEQHLAWRLQVEVPEQLQADLRTAMESAGIPVPKSEERWAKAMTALKVRLPHPPSRPWLQSIVAATHLEPQLSMRQ